MQCAFNTSLNMERYAQLQQQKEGRKLGEGEKKVDWISNKYNCLCACLRLNTNVWLVDVTADKGVVIMSLDMSLVTFTVRTTDRKVFSCWAPHSSIPLCADVTRVASPPAANIFSPRPSARRRIRNTVSRTCKLDGGSGGKPVSTMCLPPC